MFDRLLRRRSVGGDGWRNGRPVTAPIVGAVTIASVVAIIGLVAVQFRGGFGGHADVILLTERAGLVMNPDAKVQLLGTPVGKVDRIEERPDGTAAIHLSIDPAQLQVIPANVRAEISATTVFGAKYVQLIPPDDPTPESMYVGQVLTAQNVTVEINTVFQQLTTVLAKIEPEKLNETLGAIATAFNGRGEKIGETLSGLDELLTKIEPHLPALTHDLELAPQFLSAYADAAPDIAEIAANTTAVGQTIVDRRDDLDAALLSAIGLAELGHAVLDQNSAPLAQVLGLLVPTTDLARHYNASLYCGVAGLLVMANMPPADVPGVNIMAGLEWGGERYRYPSNLPKVAATGGPQCTGLPRVPFETSPPYVVTDTNANPFEYDNPGVVLNSDGLKRLLFGAIDGPPRNIGQIGQPG
ncbi:MCE family protein [Mycobacterium sp.]|uniref:MCE family protein n=1 Tax=Mycobacterium sp. TaxID=1785 RepID=UPI002D9D5336|nr:MCE family protein [Mycobacterium sp.]